MSRREREIGGLDELFGAGPEVVAEEEEPQAPVERRRSWVPWVLRNAALVTVATVVTVAGLRIAGIKISVLLIVAAFVSLRLLMLATAAVAQPPVPRRSTLHGEDSGDYQWAGTDSLRAAVGRWERSLQWAQSDATRFSRNVLPVLAELTDERLRLRHGITRTSDPRRARELVGDELWAFLAEPGRRPPKPRDLDEYLTRLERL
jgi:hypothetical protein